MKKKLQQDIESALSNALEPPKRRAPSPALNQVLAEYAAPAVPQHGIPSVDIPQPVIPRRDIPPEAPPKPKQDAAELVSAEHGYYPTFNDISDSLIPKLKLNPYEQVILLRLYRLSHGWQKDTCTVGHTKLAKQTNISRSKVQITIAALISLGLVEHVAEQGNAGTEYRVLPGVPVLQRGIPDGGIPSSKEGMRQRGIPQAHGIPQGGHNKNKVLNTELKKELSLCDKCRQSSGYIYADPDDLTKGVVRCDHK